MSTKDSGFHDTIQAIQASLEKELGVGLLINKDIPGNVEELCSSNDRIADFTTKLNKMNMLKVVQAYAPISSHDDQPV